MRVLVCGGRDYKNRAKVFATLDGLNRETPILLLIHGACPYGGADLLAEDWAKRREVPYYGLPAKFAAIGRKAGPIRNQKMLCLKPDLVVAFPGGTGTAGMVTLARSVGIEVIEVPAQ